MTTRREVIALYSEAAAPRPLRRWNSRKVGLLRTADSPAPITISTVSGGRRKRVGTWSRRALSSGPASSKETRPTWKTTSAQFQPAVVPAQADHLGAREAAAPGTDVALPLGHHGAEIVVALVGAR